MRYIWTASLIVVLLLTGCYQRGTVKNTNLFEPYRIADVNIPFADNLHTSQFDRVSELEVDDYGRRYFSYRTYSVMYAADVEIHIICQMTRDDKVFYYPDYCYLIRTENDAAFTDNEVSRLKTLNDWNLPLEEDKMYATPYSQYHKDVTNESNIHSAILSHLGLSESFGTHYNGLEIRDGSEQLLFVHVFSRDESGKATADSEAFYLMICRTGQKSHIVMSQQVDGSLSCQEQVCLFREAWLSKVDKK